MGVWGYGRVDVWTCGVVGQFERNCLPSGRGFWSGSGKVICGFGNLFGWDTLFGLRFLMRRRGGHPRTPEIRSVNVTCGDLLEVVHSIRGGKG